MCVPCRFDAVVHFAALKAVGESIEKPLEYYKNNIGSAISLLESMRTTDCRVCFKGIATVMASVHSQNLPAVFTQQEQILQLVYDTEMRSAHTFTPR
jgi:UDP-glucose 4-epimerase